MNQNSCLKVKRRSNALPVTKVSPLEGTLGNTRSYTRESFRTIVNRVIKDSTIVRISKIMSGRTKVWHINVPIVRKRLRVRRIIRTTCLFTQESTNLLVQDAMKGLTTRPNMKGIRLIVMVINGWNEDCSCILMFLVISR